MLLESVLKFLNHLEFSHICVETVKDASKDIDCVLDLGVSEICSVLVVRIVDTVISLSIGLTHLVLVVLISLLALLFFDKLVVDVLEIFEARHRILFVLGVALLLESVIRNPQHFELILQLAQIVNRVFQIG